MLRKLSKVFYTGTILFMAVAAIAGWRLSAQPPSLEPAWVEVDPNAIQKPDVPMRIEVGGIPAGLSVRLQILQDCNGDSEPDSQGQGTCKSPLHDRQSAKAGDDRVVRDRLEIQTLTQLPQERPLWLWATGSNPERGRLALFGIVSNPCDLWQSILDAFQLGPCNPFATSQSLRRHRGPYELAGKTFEVRRLALDGEAPVAVPGTENATGLAWESPTSLLITTAASSKAPAALLRVPIQGGEPAMLWKAQAGGGALLPTAPLDLPGNRVAFVRQPLAGESKPGEPAAVLSLWSDGKVDPGRNVQLPFRIHQLLKSDREGRSILALTLGAGDNQPAFLTIDLAKGEVEYLGFHNALYQAALRSPRGEHAVISFEDNSGRSGWELALVGDKGEWKKDLSSRTQDDLLPSWRPDGREIAFLAEVQERGKEQQ